jgi:uncharacterized protein YbjT (DUF2867 family)
MAIILVTGATGFVGRAVVREACRAGYEVRALVRDPSRAGWLAGRHGVELVAGDVLEASSVSNAMRGVTGAVHLVGIINEWGRNTFDRAHRQATVHVVDAARQEGVRRYVHMSALGTRPDAPSRYHQTKWAAEEHVRQSGLAWTIFRPSLIYGPGDISINVLAQTMRRAPVAPVLGTGHTRIQPVAVDVVARCFVAALHTDASVGQTVDLCGPDALTWNELMDAIMRRIDVTRPKLHLPLPVARVAGSVLGRLMFKPPFNRDQAIMAAEDNVGDPGPAERMFGVTQTSLERALAGYLC